MRCLGTNILILASAVKSYRNANHWLACANSTEQFSINSFFRHRNQLPSENWILLRPDYLLVENLANKCQLCSCARHNDSCIGRGKFWCLLNYGGSSYVLPLFRFLLLFVIRGLTRLVHVLIDLFSSLGMQWCINTAQIKAPELQFSSAPCILKFQTNFLI